MKVFRYLKPWHYLSALVILGLVYCQVTLDLKLPDYFSDIISLVLTGGTSGQIWDIGKTMLLVCLGSTACIIGVGFLSSLIGASFSRDLRQGVFKKVQTFSMKEINGFSTASLITRSTNDITQIQNTVIMTLRMAVTAPIMGIKAVIKIVDKSSQLSWITVVAMALLLAIILIMFFLVVPKFTKIQRLTDKLNNVTRENLTGLRVVRAYNAEDYQEEKSEKANAELTNTHLFTSRILSILGPSMNLIMMGVSLAISWIGAYLINGNLLELPVLTAFTNYAMQVLSSFMMLTMIFVLLPRGIVSMKRVGEILNTNSEICDGKGEIDKQNNLFIKEDQEKIEMEVGTVEFKDVSFKYPDATDYVLENVSFKVNQGETIAFIGSTGSGKSTLINLVPRFYDATDGEILINGVNIKDYKLKDLHDIIGYVPQKGTLFSGSVESNLKYGNEDITSEEMGMFINIAQAKFVNRLDGGLDYNVSQGATNLSGGQKQRLSIARALIKKPQIYIYDDSFSALDYKTDKQLRSRLKELNSTNMIVAQRIGTIMDADQIIVLDEGKVVGKGTHKELLESCKVYQEIAYSQLNKEEL